MRFKTKNSLCTTSLRILRILSFYYRRLLEPIELDQAAVPTASADGHPPPTCRSPTCTSGAVGGGGGGGGGTDECVSVTN
eukprot:SAG22_NODE_654_length_8129_cov_7.457410_5_plen_80_part_00